MKKTIKQHIKEIAQKWVDKTGNTFYNEFIEIFPRQKDYNQELKDRDMYGDDWYPEGEVELLIDIFDVDIEKGNPGVDTENWCDFFNEICENRW